MAEISSDPPDDAALEESSASERPRGVPERGLVIVATPIGHLDDITLRALHVLEAADVVLAEDTRRTRILLDHHGLRTPLRAFHAHSTDDVVRTWTERLQEGALIALVSDAGTPLVSDPGARLVAAARDAGLHVTTAPGASAVLAALSIAGLRAEHFRFAGFVPRQGKRRRQALQTVAESAAASVLFESPKRLPRLLEDLAPLLGERRLAVCRELTKRYEEAIRGTAEELHARFSEGVRGEITLVVEAIDEAPSEADPAVLAERFLAEGQHPRKAAKAIAAQTALSAAEAYALLESLRK